MEAFATIVRGQAGWMGAIHILNYKDALILHIVEINLHECFINSLEHTTVNGLFVLYEALPIKKPLEEYHVDINIHLLDLAIQDMCDLGLGRWLSVKTLTVQT